MDHPRKSTATDFFVAAGFAWWPLLTHSVVSHAHHPQRAHCKFIENNSEAIARVYLAKYWIRSSCFSKEILENEKIVKVGVESKGDADLLFEDYSIYVKGTLDLRYLADLALCVPSGLAKMSEDYLNIKLNKSWSIHNRWEKSTLSQKQIDYAAKDVQVAIELFKYFANKLQAETLPNQPFNIQHFIDKYCMLHFDARYYRRAPPPPPPTNSNSAESTIDYHEIWSNLQSVVASIFIISCWK